MAIWCTDTGRSVPLPIRQTWWRREGDTDNVCYSLEILVLLIFQRRAGDSYGIRGNSLHGNSWANTRNRYCKRRVRAQSEVLQVSIKIFSEFFTDFSFLNFRFSTKWFVLDAKWTCIFLETWDGSEECCVSTRCRWLNRTKIGRDGRIRNGWLQDTLMRTTLRRWTQLRTRCWCQKILKRKKLISLW